MSSRIGGRKENSSKRYPIPFDLHYFLVKIGWEFVDDIIWKKPESSVKNRNAGFLQHRKPLAYKLNDVSIDLNINETLIVINALAVKRAALRGGLWSTAGKRVEKG